MYFKASQLRQLWKDLPEECQVFKHKCNKIEFIVFCRCSGHHWNVSNWNCIVWRTKCFSSTVLFFVNHFFLLFIQMSWTSFPSCAVLMGRPAQKGHEPASLSVINYPWHSQAYFFWPRYFHILVLHQNWGESIKDRYKKTVRTITKWFSEQWTDSGKLNCILTFTEAVNIFIFNKLVNLVKVQTVLRKKKQQDLLFGSTELITVRNFFVYSKSLAVFWKCRANCFSL